MNVSVNGEEKEVAEQTSLAELIQTLKLPAQRIAVELNLVVIRRPAWETTRLKENDAIEVVHFVGGGQDDFSSTGHRV